MRDYLCKNELEMSNRINHSLLLLLFKIHDRNSIHSRIDYKAVFENSLNQRTIACDKVSNKQEKRKKVESLST